LTLSDSVNDLRYAVLLVAVTKLGLRVRELAQAVPTINLVSADSCEDSAGVTKELSGRTSCSSRENTVQGRIAH